MVLATFYFQLHQPFRLHPDRDKFLWDEKNKEVFEKVADKCYIPATKMFTEILKNYPQFKMTMSTSGTFLEQAQIYRPDVIKALQELYDTGKEREQFEFLEETYYHSLAGLFEDSTKLEFRKQVSLHRQKLEEIFGEGVAPTSFRNTELMYNNSIAETAEDMGYKTILCEKRDDMFFGGEHISPNAIFRARNTNKEKLELLVLPRNREMSDDIAYRFPRIHMTAERYAQNIANIPGEAVILGYDYEHIGEHIWGDRGIFEFWKHLPEFLSRHENVVVANPRDIAEKFKEANCPFVDINPFSTSSWADVGKNTDGWLGNETQNTLFKDIEGMEVGANRVKGDLRTMWRHLTTSDQIYFLHESGGQDGSVHNYFSPYGSLSRATRVITRKIDDLSSRIDHFNILTKAKRTAIVLVTPEVAKLPEEMGQLARYVSAKAGGLGDVVSALCEGLKDRVDVHIVTLDLKRRFQEESGKWGDDYRAHVANLPRGNIHLIKSSIFDKSAK